MKVLTANRLSDGEAVWFETGVGWAETIENADIAYDKSAEDVLESVGKTATVNDEVVDANLIDIDLVCGRIVPNRLRERIRVAGPTNRLDLGKQARADFTPAQ